jgi:hypothetical protein
MGAMKSYRCAICGHAVEYAGALPALYPFCCDRCRNVDLGRWLLEQYSIDRDVTPEDVAHGALPTADYADFHGTKRRDGGA